MGDVAEMLTQQLTLQRHMASQGRAIDPTSPDLTQEQRIQFIKDMYIALVREAGEALDEVGWKPWGTARHIHGEAMLREIVDLWHFVMNLMLAAGPFIDEVDNEQELADLFIQFYASKNEVNWQRALQDYNGFTEKCAYCGRDLDEVTRLEQIQAVGAKYCNTEHFQLANPGATIELRPNA